MRLRELNRLPTSMNQANVMLALILKASSMLQGVDVTHHRKLLKFMCKKKKKLVSYLIDRRGAFTTL